MASVRMHLEHGFIGMTREGRCSLGCNLTARVCAPRGHNQEEPFSIVSSPFRGRRERSGSAGWLAPCHTEKKQTHTGIILSVDTHPCTNHSRAWIHRAEGGQGKLSSHFGEELTEEQRC